mgnify:CR=1 FL=1
MKIKYNAPTALTYSFFCTLVVALDQSIMHGLTRAFFTVPNADAFDLTSPLNYVRLFTHIAGHADWNHLVSNLAYILLLGPMLEEAYGSITMFLMIVVTGFVTGVLNACFFPNPLLGASGVVFMMILLASFTNHEKDDVPLTFILIVILYLGREILAAFKGDDISQFAHLAGGLCGSLFGFFQPSRPVSARSISARVAANRSRVSAEPEKTAGARIAAKPKPVKITVKGKSAAPAPHATPNRRSAGTASKPSTAKPSTAKPSRERSAETARKTPSSAQKAKR